MNDRLELVACMKGGHTPGFNGDQFTGARVATWPRRFLTNLEIAKAGDFDIRSLYQLRRNQVKERINHVLRFALVQADLFEQQISQVGLGERWRFEAFNRKIHIHFQASIRCANGLITSMPNDPAQT